MGQGGVICVVFHQLEWVDVRDVVTMGHERAQKHIQADHLVTSELVLASCKTNAA